jgi:hypothetical protein
MLCLAEEWNKGNIHFSRAELIAGISAAPSDYYSSVERLLVQERSEFRSKMHTAITAEEREQIRAQHHEVMKGVTLPDAPPPNGGGMGPRGMGPGAGIGPGGGMGPGGGRNP